MYVLLIVMSAARIRSFHSSRLRFEHFHLYSPTTRRKKEKKKTLMTQALVISSMVRRRKPKTDEIMGFRA